MVEKSSVGDLVVDISADVSSVKSALASVQEELKRSGEEAKKASSGMELFGTLMQGSVIGVASSATSSVIGLTKSLLGLASESPEMQIAMAEFNEQMRIIGEDLGPEASKVMENFTDIIGGFWSGGGKEGFTSFLSWIDDSLVPRLKTARDIILAILSRKPPETPEETPEGTFRLTPKGMPLPTPETFWEGVSELQDKYFEAWGGISKVMFGEEIGGEVNTFFSWLGDKFENALSGGKQA